MILFRLVTRGKKTSSDVPLFQLSVPNYKFYTGTTGPVMRVFREGPRFAAMANSGKRLQRRAAAGEREEGSRRRLRARRLSGRVVGSPSATSFPAGSSSATSRKLLPEASAPAVPGTICPSSVRRRRPRSRLPILHGPSARSSGLPIPASFSPHARCRAEQSVRCWPASTRPRPRRGARAGRCPSRFHAGFVRVRRWQSRSRGGSGPAPAPTRKQKPVGQSTGL